MYTKIQFSGDGFVKTQDIGKAVLLGDSVDLEQETDHKKWFPAWVERLAGFIVLSLYPCECSWKQIPLDQTTRDEDARGFQAVFLQINFKIGRAHV